MKKHIPFLLFFISVANSIPAAEPNDAARYMARGEAALEMAADDTGLQNALVEFEQATQADPSLGAAWYNAGIIADKLGRYDVAATYFFTYLQKTPNAPDAQQVQKLIYKLQYKKEESSRQAEEKLSQINAAKAQEAAKRNLAGTWIEEGHDPHGKFTTYFEARPDGKSFVMAPYMPNSNIKPYNEKFVVTVNNNYEASGTWKYDDSPNYKNGRIFERTLDGLLEPDGEKLRLHYSGVQGNINQRGSLTGYSDWEAERVFVKHS